MAPRGLIRPSPARIAVLYLEQVVNLPGAEMRLSPTSRIGVSHTAQRTGILARVALAVLVILPNAAGAQAAQSQRHLLRVTVLDSSSGAPVVRAFGKMRRSFTYGTPVGELLISADTVATDTLSVFCEPKPETQYPVVRVPVSELLTRGDPLIVRIDAAACDQRPLVAISGEFRGYWERGFEHSGFVPCSGTVSGLTPALRALLGRESWIWVERSADATRAPGVQGGSRTVDGIARSYVRWVGSLEGPGRYGHGGAGRYLFRVRAVLEVARDAPHSC
jgi:hypothetical protein